MEPCLNILLTEHNLIIHGPTLDQHGVDMEVLMRLQKEDLMHLGMTLGEAVHLLVEVRRFSELLITEDIALAFLNKLSQHKSFTGWKNCAHITDGASKLLAKKWEGSAAFHDKKTLVLGVRSMPRGLDDLVVHWPGEVHFAGLDDLSAEDVTLLKRRVADENPFWTEITLSKNLLEKVPFEALKPLMPFAAETNLRFSREQGVRKHSWTTPEDIEACFLQKTLWPTLGPGYSKEEAMALIEAAIP